MQKTPIIKAEHLTFSYPGDAESKPVRALDDVSFEIEEGSFTAILGHNGSGKSTLAKLLCMVNYPDSGKLLLCGKDLTAPDVTEEDILAARRDIGMVFQNPDNQIVASIVEEDVAFGCENLGIPSAEIRKRVDQALEEVGMTKYARSSPHNLSGGQKQRVAIAGVIAMKRKCVIFDESTAMLDPLGRQDVMNTAMKLNREDGITVILITHYMSEAAMADRIIVMNQGKILRDGTPSEVFSDPEAMWDAGLDVPQTTELLYKMRKAGYDVRLDLFDENDCAAEIARAMKRAREGK
ncbi:MAG: energy-coupling factor transporter ATPase [Clostridia bacterium]|nr:energy-coupling factor transporter ATPase [Clostridia bacterium]